MPNLRSLLQITHASLRKHHSLLRLARLHAISWRAWLPDRCSKFAGSPSPTPTWEPGARFRLQRHGRILTALGSDYDRFGVEVNEAAAEQARSRGITIIPDCGLDDTDIGSFEGIVLSDVYEHLLEEPTITMRRLAARLAPGAQLIIVTGLADAVRPIELLGEHWYFRIAGHLQ